MTDPHEWDDEVAGTPSDRPIPTGEPHRRHADHEAVAPGISDPDALLEVDGVTLRFGGVVALGKSVV